MKSVPEMGGFLPKPYLTKAQRNCLVDFAKGIAGRGGRDVIRISYRLVGSEDLADQRKATAMLKALQSQDWDSAFAHYALAGTNNLLLGILLRLDTEDGCSSDHWVAMRSPFELMDWPVIVAAGVVDRLPPVTLDVLC